MYALNLTLLKDLENVYVAIASARLRGGKGDTTPTVYQKLALVPSQRRSWADSTPDLRFGLNPRAR